MRAIEIGATAICTAGTILWVYGYFVTGHPSLLDWSSFSPFWISEFLPNFEFRDWNGRKFCGHDSGLWRRSSLKLLAAMNGCSEA